MHLGQAQVFSQVAEPSGEIYLLRGWVAYHGRYLHPPVPLRFRGAR
jgi:hypothetical protein